MSKKCFRCSEVKDLSEFSKDASHSDGFTSSCKQCRKAMKNAVKPVMVEPPPDMKVCLECGKCIKLSNFWKDDTSAKGVKPRCIECEKPRNIASYQRNREQKRDHATAKYYEDIELSRSLSKDKYKRNLENIRAYGKKYRENNKEYFANYMRDFRARGVRPMVNQFSKNYFKILCKAYNVKCANPECQTPTSKLTLDHVIPLSKGGTHENINFQILCLSCNSAKGNRSFTDYRNSEMGIVVDIVDGQPIRIYYPNNNIEDLMYS